MNKALFIASLGIISFFCFIPHLAFANSSSFNRLKEGPYAGLQGGTGGMMTKSEDTSTVTTHQHSLRHDFAGRILGSYLWADNPFMYGAEVGYSVYPNNKYILDGNEYKYRGYTFDLLATGKYYFTDHWNILGKLGIAYSTQKYEARITQTEKTEHDWLPEISLGFGYDIDTHWMINLTYTYIVGEPPKALLSSQNNIKEYYDDVAPISLVMLGIIYHLD